MSSSRNITFDIARVLCTIWIIGIWHYNAIWLPAYKFDSILYQHFWTITIAVLAFFTFQSGHFLKRYEFETWQDVLKFYKKRFFRFYPLFFSASFLLCIWMSISGTKNSIVPLFLKTVTGISMFLPPTIMTLWYFSMLMFFYMITPLLNILCKKNINTVYFLLIFCCIIVALPYDWDIDMRLPLFFIFYALGLILKNNIVEYIQQYRWGILALVGIVGLNMADCYNNVYDILYGILGSVAIISFSHLLSMIRIRLFERIVIIASYSTMCVYLFHRFMHSIILKFFEYIGYCGIPLYGVVCSIILFFVVGYIIQRLYDTLINKLLAKNSN